MPTELLWTGTDNIDVFVDAKYNDEYHPSERPHEVPDERVEWLLDHDGWERPDAQTAADTARTIPANDHETTADADADSDADADADADDPDDIETAAAAAVRRETFDADAFIDDSWQSVQSKIRSGEADDHLAAIEAAEREREGGPREESVIEAIEHRRGELAAE